MSIPLYFDVHVPGPILKALREREVDILTAQEDGTSRLPDPELLDRATRLGRTIFTQDEDFLAEATSRQRHGEPFAGVIYAHQLRVSIGQCVQDLELIAKCLGPEDFIGRVQHLPLR